MIYTSLQGEPGVPGTAGKPVRLFFSLNFVRVISNTNYYRAKGENEAKKETKVISAHQDRLVRTNSS